MYGRKEEKQGEILTKIKEGESFQEAVTLSGECHHKISKMSKDRGLLGLPAPRSLTASASIWWGAGGGGSAGQNTVVKSQVLNERGQRCSQGINEGREDK